MKQIPPPVIYDADTGAQLSSSSSSSLPPPSKKPRQSSSSSLSEEARKAKSTVALKDAQRLHLHSFTQHDLSLAEKNYKTVIELTRDNEEMDAALYGLGLLLCQQKRDDEARLVLKDGGFQYRLAPEILGYDVTQVNAAGLDPAAIENAKHAAIAFDNALPPSMLQHLQTHFNEKSPFWSEHNYCVNPPSPYFSYIHEIKTKALREELNNNLAAVSSKINSEMGSLDAILHHIHQLAISQYPDVIDANFCEWWAHCRPHASGHQMHFDSDDEGRGGVRNPIVTCVIMLSEGVGGPTLVTDQAFGVNSLASHGWLVMPNTNRCVVFRANLLHGVIPGNKCPVDEKAKRMTFMAAFWKDIKIRSAPDGSPGSSRAFPRSPRPEQTWVIPHLSPLHQQGGGGAASLPVSLSSKKDKKQQQQQQKKGNKKEEGENGHHHDDSVSHKIGVLVGPQRVDRIWVEVSPQVTPLATLKVMRRLPPYESCFQGF